MDARCDMTALTKMQQLQKKNQVFLQLRVAASLCCLNTSSGQGPQTSVSILHRRIPKISVIFSPGRAMCRT